jgi:hypothetical protein
MQHICLRGFIGPNRSKNDTVCGVSGTSVRETRTVDSHGEVSLIHLQQTDNLFITVDNEVSTKLFGFFFAPNQQVWRIVLEMASV